MGRHVFRRRRNWKHQSGYGAGGDDTLVGGYGADRLDGGIGADTVSYADAKNGLVANLATASENTSVAKGDVYISIENLGGSSHNDVLAGNSSKNALAGGSGNDVLMGAGGADKLYGGSGSDTASYANSRTGVVASLANAALNRNDAAGDVYVSIESVTGSHYDDSLAENAVANTLNGGRGNDRLYGDAGNDKLIGGAGADYFNGGTGIDRASYEDARIGVVVSLSTPSSNTGDAKGDTFASIEGLVGSAFNDVLIGNGYSNTLNGGDGNDTLITGAGNDVVFGGTGKDVFVFKSLADMSFADIDVIGDLAGGDKIDLSALDADAILEGNQAFVFIGHSSYGGNGRVGDLWWDQNDGPRRLWGDIDGDGQADLSIEIRGAGVITESMFIL